MKFTLPTFISFILPLALIGCATAPSTDSGKQSLVSESTSALDSFKQSDSGIEPFLKKAHGYAIFPGIGKGGVGIGGAYGHGVVFEDGKVVGYCDVSQGSIGFQLGGQQFSELISFQSKEALERFENNNFEFSAQVSAVAIQAGAAAAAKYENGVAVFTQTVGGLMYEASVGGQKFGFQPIKPDDGATAQAE